MPNADTEVMEVMEASAQKSQNLSQSSSTDIRPQTPKTSSEQPLASPYHDTPKAKLDVSTPISEASEAGAPMTPTERTNGALRDSMNSIALSESSLHFEQHDFQHGNDTQATPRVSGIRHMRKPSSIEILHNSWGPLVRQSTLFDSTHDQSPENPGDGVRDSDADSPALTDESPSFDEANSSSEEVQARSPASSIAESSPMITLNDLRSSVATSSAVSIRSVSVASSDEHEVDWLRLDKNEEQEKEDRDLPEGGEDESTAFLLARLEQENAKFSQDPKSTIPLQKSRGRKGSRPPSMAQLKRLVQDRNTASIRSSLAISLTMPDEPPPMTELEFWTALVQDYTSTAARLPTLTATKIRAGIPPPLRGVVWTSMAGARDRDLEEAYETLQHQESPYEGIINKDVGRSFPGVELFREAGGEGQRMLGRVLKCFSLHDKDIGYCQGLGFLVGPLLMNMGERDAFCVLVRLMDHFALRPSFLPSLSGLHMRIYQFSTLLQEHNATLSNHLTELGVEPAYLSQWFLSCFAVTCPLPLLFRIYDVIFAEGANETVMRVAMALMRRNEEAMLASTEFEEIMQLLLGRGLWDSYGGNPDELVDDFTSLGNIITHTKLNELAKEFDSQSNEAVGQSAGFLPDVQAAASRFLGRLWAPSTAVTASKASTLTPSAADRDVSPNPAGRSSSFFLRRSPSKQSVGTVNDSHSSEGTQYTESVRVASTAPTEADALDTKFRESSVDAMSIKSRAGSGRNVSASIQASKEQQDLHGQIEDLLTALSEMQREHAQLSAMLQKEREDRTEDHRILRRVMQRVQPSAVDKTGFDASAKGNKRHTLPNPLRAKATHHRHASHPSKLDGVQDDSDNLETLLSIAQTRLTTTARFSASFETKAQLRNKLVRVREQLESAEAHARDLNARQRSTEESLESFQTENEDLRIEVKELRSRVNDEFKRRQKLEHTIQQLRAEIRTIERKERDRVKRTDSSNEVPTLSRLDTAVENFRASVSGIPNHVSAGGLRQLRLGREGRRDSASSIQSLRMPDTTQQSAVSSASSVMPFPETPLSETPFSPKTATPGPGALAEAAPFGKRTTSLVTQDVFNTREHEVVPEEALLLELVNSKTAEAQARQEVDEMRRALNIQRRKHEEAYAQLQQQFEAMKEEMRKMSDATDAVRHASSSMMTTTTASPSTPSSKEPDAQLLATSSSTPAAARATPSPTPPAASNTVGGWFWSRRTASTTKAVITPDESS